MRMNKHNYIHRKELDSDYAPPARKSQAVNDGVDRGLAEVAKILSDLKSEAPITRLAAVWQLATGGRVGLTARTLSQSLGVSLADAEIAMQALPALLKGKRRAKREMLIVEWLDSLGGEDAIQADDPIFAYAEKIGLPVEFLELAWEEFVLRMTDRKIRKKDWRAHYRNAVRGNWFHLWWFGDGGAALTTAGQQAQKALEAMELNGTHSEEENHQ